jgi:hypothetical protein
LAGLFDLPMPQQTSCVAIRRRKLGTFSGATLRRITFVKRRGID